MDLGCGSGIYCGCLWCVVVSGLRDMPRRYSAGVYCGTVSGGICLGCECGSMAAFHIFPVLEGDRNAVFLAAASVSENFEKNTKFYKNFICILEKMGYNKME